MIAEGSASAATTPVVYAAHADGWHAYRKPGSFYFGNGGAPYFTNLTWKSWGANSAWGTGRLWIHKSCTPSYKCGFTSRWVGVYLSLPRYHGSTRYYDKMSVELSVSGKLKWGRLLHRSEGPYLLLEVPSDLALLVRHVNALVITVRALTAWMPSGVRVRPGRGAPGLGGDGRDDQGGDPVAASGNCWA